MVQTGLAAIQAELDKRQDPDKAKRAARPRKGFAPHLERVEIVIEPVELPEHAGKPKILIGEDVSERLDVVAAKFRVIVTRRPKYAFKNEDGVIQAFKPRHRPISSRAASRPRHFWRRSRSQNTPMACRSTARKRSTPATRSTSIEP